jgi:PAS domain S-box-containing protein
MAKGATQRDFEALVEHCPLALVISGQEGRIVLVNREAERIFGYGRAELLGQAVEVLVPERFRRGHVRHRSGYLASPGMLSLGANRCLLGRRKDGTEFSTEIGLSHVETGDGVLVMSAIADMTERKQAEEKLQASETRFRRLFEAAQDGILLLDIDSGQVVDANPFLARLLGSSREKILGKRLWELGLFADVAASKEAFAELKREGYIRYEDLPLRAIDGRRVDVEFVSNVYDVNGSKVIQCNIRDITDRKRAEEKLQASETRFRRLFESAQDGILLLDIDSGQVVDANPFLALLLGSPREDLLGKRLWELGLFADVAASKKAFAELKREGYIRYEDLPLRAIDGRRVEVEFVSNVYDVNDSNVIQCNIRDITDRKRAAGELRRLTARLMEGQEDERRQASYDIHDGLGQLMTAASMHLEAFAGYRASADLEAAEEEFTKAKRCLQDAVVEMRRMVSELGPLLLEDVGLVEASRRLLSDVAERTGWEAEFESEGPDGRLDGMAETAIFRIVQEALANIAKHANSPKVRVAFRREHNALHLEVRDWGRGFLPSGVPDKPEHGRHVGLLGMRERAALIGADLSVESVPEGGTRVTVIAPVAPPAARLRGGKKAEVVRMAEATKLRGSPRDAITVLIADDHPMVREGLRSMLDAEGIEIIGEAVNGADAVERAQQMDPDVVLMDVRMPDMDGLTATEVIKQTSPQTSVIVITSYESKEYLRRAIEAGAAGYLLKGMSRESLIDAIRLVKGGGSLIDARLLSELLKEMGVEGSRFQGVEGALEALTPREQDVLNLLVRGLTNKEIASEMHYSVGTVKNVVQRVIEKLGVSDRTQAAVYAVRAGVNPPA